MITLRERGVHPESTVIETCKYLTALSPNQMTAIIMNKRLEGKQIWTGVLEWTDEREGDFEAKCIVTVPECEEKDQPEISDTATWVKLITMQIFALPTTFPIRDHYPHSQRVCFDFGNDARTIQYLYKAFTSGYLGIVKLDGKLSKGLMLWWNTEEQYFQGVISENQAQFMNDINTIKERHTDEEKFCLPVILHRHAEEEAVLKLYSLTCDDPGLELLLDDFKEMQDILTIPNNIIIMWDNIQLHLAQLKVMMWKCVMVYESFNPDTKKRLGQIEIKRTYDAFKRLGDQFHPLLTVFFNIRDTNENKYLPWWNYYMSYEKRVRANLQVALQSEQPYQRVDWRKGRPPPTDNDHLTDDFDVAKGLREVLLLNKVFRSRGVVQLRNDLNELLRILTVLIKKYGMPNSVKDFIFDLQTIFIKMIKCSFEEGNGLDMFADMLRVLQSSHHIYLNQFFNLDTNDVKIGHFTDLEATKNSATWWHHYSYWYLQVCTTINMAITDAYSQYKECNFLQFKPKEGPDDVTTWQCNPNFILSLCHNCDKRLAFIFKAEGQETYPIQIPLVDDEGARRVCVCSTKCHKLTKQKELSFWREMGVKVQKKTLKMCDVCYKEKTAKVHLMKCGKCYNKSYCSKKCQLTDWPEHRKLCKKIRKALEV